jgi:hypothetical protein
MLLTASVRSTRPGELSMWVLLVRFSEVRKKRDQQGWNGEIEQ